MSEQFPWSTAEEEVFDFSPPVILPNEAKRRRIYKAAGFASLGSLLVGMGLVFISEALGYFGINRR